MPTRVWRVAAAGAGLLLLAAGVLLDAPRGAVDWRHARVVVFESDDWGLCGFFPGDPPTPAARSALGGGFPEPYWFSTLEDSADVAELAAVLGRHRGRDGLPPVLQANMIVSALWAPPPAATATAPTVWRRVDLPELPPAYARPGLDSAVDDAIAQGVWCPELHGAFHYDPARRLAAVAAAAPAIQPLLRESLLFPGSDTAWELGFWRETDTLRDELSRSLRIFAARFGRPPGSICAPDYVWDARCERLWSEHGVTVIQAKREQRDSRRPGGDLAARALKLVARARDHWLHPERVYLERNCRFEPAQAVDGRATVTACLAEIRAAWAAGQPAIVETHRINYVSRAPGAGAAGRQRLDELLTALAAAPGGAPLYLTDDEIAQLQRRGTSATMRGAQIVLRNLTNSSRMAVESSAAGGVAQGRLLPPGATARLARIVATD